MYDTARRVALVKQRVRENTRRRQRREASMASPLACMLLCAVLDAGGGHGRRAGATGSMGRVRRDAAAGGRGRLRAGRPLSPLPRRQSFTALCFRLRKRENQKKGGADKPNRHEQEEKSQ